MERVGSGLNPWFVVTGSYSFVSVIISLVMELDDSRILEERRDNRPRSNTWPLPDPSEFTKSEREVDQTANLKQLNEGPKKGSRKNAWGNLSYADLITQAIQSSSEQRLTLSQIYDWMVNTVPYFRDKGDSNSSAGWKVRL